MSAYVRNPQTIPDDSVGGSSVRQGVAEQNNVAIDDLYTVINAHANNEDGRSHVQIDEALDTISDVDGAKDAAEAARDKAQEWAESPENVEVETGAYSAKHHAIKAAASAADAESFLVGLPLDISQGGTGETNPAAALDALGGEPANAAILKRDTSAILTAGYPAAPAAMAVAGPTPATGALQTLDTSGGAVSLAVPIQAGVIRFVVTGGNALNPSAGYASIDGEYDPAVGLAQGEIVSDGTRHMLTIVNGVSA